MITNAESPANNGHALWPQVFRNPNPVEVEIGSGNGIFLLAVAQRRRDTNFYGIEKAHNRAVALAAAVERHKLSNAFVLHADAGCVVESLLPAASVHAFHIYFPDPWWKRKHYRRRIFTPPFVDGLARALIPGGYVYVATDVESVFALMRQSLAACPRFREDTSKPSPRLAITTFERKGLARGAQIYQSAFALREQGSTNHPG